jgi:hypothetical protein
MGATKLNPRTAGGKLADPQFRRDRAVKAGRASQSLDSYIGRIVDRAPELTPEQRDKLATLLRPGRTPVEREAALQ